MEQQLNAASAFRPRGFSLIELLSVIAIIALVGTFSLPAFQNITHSIDMTNGSNLLVDQLRRARQTAITTNRQVEFRVYKMPSAPGKTDWAYRALRFYGYDETGTTSHPEVRLQWLPASVVVSQNPSGSTLLKSGNGVETGTENLSPLWPAASYISFSFRPDGSTTLSASGTAYFLSLVPALGSQAFPPKNFFTVQIDPATGRVATYHP